MSFANISRRPSYFADISPHVSYFVDDLPDASFFAPSLIAPGLRLVGSGRAFVCNLAVGHVALKMLRPDVSLLNDTATKASSARRRSRPCRSLSSRSRRQLCSSRSSRRQSSPRQRGRRPAPCPSPRRPRAMTPRELSFA